LGSAALDCLRRRDARDLLVPLAVCAGALAVMSACSAITRSLHLLTTTPGVQLTLAMARSHLVWLGQGMLRFGDGLAVTSQGPLRAALTLAAALVTIAALTGAVAQFRVALTPSSPRDRRARALRLHSVFWALALICAAAAYVFTNVAVEPSDRYILIALPAVAALVAPAVRTRAGSLAVTLGASVLALAGLVALASGDPAAELYRGTDVAHMGAIERLVDRLHLRVGYAGYWDAASLQWSSGEQLEVHPLIEAGGHTEPSPLARAASWYVPRRATPSYLVLAPRDDEFPGRLPADIPAPERSYRLGDITVDVYPYDLALLLR
ncbi:MAG: hypothetical protein ACRDMJ_15240, partial [Solirubrobacteraceae bacterium]